MPAPDAEFPGYRWGVDIGSRKLCIAASNGALRRWVVGEPKARGLTLAGDLWILRRRVMSYATTMARSYPPVLTVVEQPAGRNVPPSLWAAFGIICEGIHNALFSQFGTEPLIDTVQPAQWKKAVLGRGDINTAGYLADAQLRFSKNITDPDVAASLWISYYAHTLELR